MGLLTKDEIVNVHYKFGDIMIRINNNDNNEQAYRNSGRIRKVQYDSQIDETGRIS